MCLVDRLFIANYTVIVLVGVTVNNLCVASHTANKACPVLGSVWAQGGSSALFPASELQSRRTPLVPQLSG